MKTKNVFLHHPEIDGEIREESVILSLKNLKFNRVKSVKESDKKIENLYDLRVLDVPNYSTDISLVHNGGGRRKGSFAIYLEPWHYDVEDFLNLRKNHGKEEMRARDLFLALWIPDLFMERVRDNSEWTLFSPDEAPGLDDVYGEEFNALYTKYEGEGKGRKSIKAQDLWYKIIESQIETGVPYMLYKDAANLKSNQKNLGTIKSSNLCTEIIEHSSPEETAVCNLASIALPKFVVGKGKKAYFDFDALKDIAYTATINLNRVIDVNYYPTKETKKSNMLHRPIGLGVQGLADTFAMLKIPFDSQFAKDLDRDIFETIYYGAMEASVDLAEKEGAYESFKGSPLSEGKFQFDLWGVKPSERWNWEALRSRVIKSGARNSLLLAPMPTASCLVPETKIQTSDGIKSYIDIMEERGIDWRSIEESGEQRWVFFEKKVKVKTRFGYLECEKIFYNGKVPVIEIETEDVKIVCSYNHKFLCLREGAENWVRADELTENDNIICS